MDVYVNGEPAGTWETVTGNTQEKTYTVSEPGIDTLAELDDFMDDEGGISYEMVNGKKVYIRYAQLPQNNTAVSVGAISDFIVATGGVLGSYKTSGTVALVSKIMVVDAIMRAMFLSIEANAVAQANIEQIHELANDYCVEGTNKIPLYVDSSGVGYVLAGAVEAVRNGLIAMGAYSNGGSEVDESSVTSSLLFNSISGYTFPISYTDAVGTAWNTGNDSTVYTIDSVTGDSPVYALIWRRGTFDTLLLVSKSSFSYHRASSAGGSGNFNSTSSTSKNSSPIYYHSPASGNVGGAAELHMHSDTPYTTVTLSSNTNVNKDMAYMVAYLGTSVPAIIGMSAAAGILAGFGDITMPLPDVWPDWYAKKKQVATPDDSDIFLRSPALPLDVPLDDIWADGYAGDSDDATEGDLAETLKQAIVAVIPDILDDIIDDTAVTEEDVYRIPVDDSGDTPPAEPPVLDGSSNGLWTMYNPTKAQVNAFGAWLWGDTLIDEIMRQFNSPIDAIIGFHQIYCTPTTGSDKYIKAGYLDSPVSAKEITDQYATIDCGSVFVDEFYGTALDYNHSHVNIYLPFVGIVPLETSVVTGSTLQVIYRIDVFTGTCLAQIKVIKQNSNAVMYAFEGNCAIQIPLTATTYCGVVSSIINLTQSGLSLFMGNMMGALKGAFATVGSGITNLTGTKQSGSMGSNAGALGIRKPYIIITRPIAYDAVEYSRQYGYPINKTVSLGSLSGYTKVKDVHLSDIPCTDDELELIEALLKDGVIIN